MEETVGYVVPSGRYWDGDFDPDMTLIDRLDALWREGVPVEGGDRIDGETARMEAVLTFWGTRADTFEGEQITRATEAWMRNVLYEEAVPTDGQQQAAESLRRDGRRLPGAPTLTEEAEPLLVTP